MRKVIKANKNWYSNQQDEHIPGLVLEVRLDYGWIRVAFAFIISVTFEVGHTEIEKAFCNTSKGFVFKR